MKRVKKTETTDESNFSTLTLEEQNLQNDSRFVYASHCILPRLIGDQRRLLQVLINLTKNAIKFTSKGSVTISAIYDHEMSNLQVSIEDTGVGIEQADQTRLFQKFGKLTRTAEQNSAGIGLGLHIVKQIVEQSHGAIEVRSAGLNQGSTFTFCMKMKAFEED